MLRRIRLRSRVFSVTALFVLTLLGSTFLLTWRAQSTQQRFSRLLVRDMRAVTLLEEVARSQSGFRERWIRTAAEEPERLKELAARYRVIQQLMDRTPLEGPDLDVLRSRAAECGAQLSHLAAVWNGTTSEQRSDLTRALTERSAFIDSEVRRLIEQRKGEIDRQLPLLERSAGSMKRTGLAVAYILAIISFAVVRGSLAKVVRPLEQLSRASRSLAEGDLAARAPVAGDAEIAQLAISFNRMAESLATSHQTLLERARTDELTQLPNFRAFREVIEHEIIRAERYNHPFGVLVVDLDRFKEFNDTYGHGAGNEALRLVAQAIRKAVRSVDVPARYGGEEFAIVLPEIDQTALGAAAERIRSSIETLPPPPGTRTLTGSIGGALFPQDAENAEEIFSVADQRLYLAKRAGRNCSVVTGGEAASLPTGL